MSNADEPALTAADDHMLLSNSELAAAIEVAWTKNRGTARDEPQFQFWSDHMKALLEEQARRARERTNVVAELEKAR